MGKGSDRRAETSDEYSFATAPFRPHHWTGALSVIVVLVLAFITTVPFANIQLARLNSFIPAVAAFIFVTDLATAVLLLNQFTFRANRALLVLATGYYGSALFAVPYALSFPGAFSASGLFGGVQTAVWIYVLWHLGFPIIVLAYALLKDRNAPTEENGNTTITIAWSFALATAVVVCCCVLCAQADALLPALMLDELRNQISTSVAAVTCSIFSTVALIVLWRRRKSILDVWLLVVLVAMSFEPILIAFPGVRFMVGFYISRFFTIAASTIVFVVLLWESGMLHRRLAQAASRLEHQRENKMLTVDAAISSIAHELRQPLASATANAEAALLLLDRTSPDVEGAREAMQSIIHDVFTFNDVLSGIRALFRHSFPGNATCDPNNVARRALRVAQWETTRSGITITSEFESRLPVVACDGTQLLQVLLNLIQDAIEAMIRTPKRHLHIRTWSKDRSFVAISVEDTGPGIDPKKLTAIFDAFVTTKPGGMGLGLTICHEIARRNGATITVKSGQGGCLFEVVLPIAKRVVDASEQR